MQSQTIKKQVYDSIKKDIMQDVYTTASVLNEKTLVEQYSVSKSPVREALVQLCSEGYLNSIPRFGYKLTTFLPSEIIEITEFRKVIELNSLEIAFPFFNPKSIKELQHLNEEAIQIVGMQNANIHWEQNVLFHLRLCGYSNNRYLIKSLAESLNICTRISNQYFTKRWNESKRTDGENHLEFVDAIESKDLSMAKAILSDDVDAFIREIL